MKRKQNSLRAGRAGVVALAEDADPQRPLKADQTNTRKTPRLVLSGRPSSKAKQTDRRVTSRRGLSASPPKMKKARKARRKMIASGGSMPTEPTSSVHASEQTAMLALSGQALSARSHSKQAKTRHSNRTDQSLTARPSPSVLAHADHSAFDSRDAVVSAAPPDSAMGQADGYTSSVGLLPDLIAALRLYCRRRQDAVLAEGNLTRQMKRVVARYLNKTEVTTAEVNELIEKGSELVHALAEARKPLHEWRRREEKIMVHLVEHLPVYAAFWNPVHGLGALGLAQIIGEAGDIANYANPAKLWRRFGLHVGGGKSFATWRAKGGLSAKDWEQAGYCPRRRSLMFTITDSLLKKQNAYKVLCDERKAVERQKAAAEGLTVAPAGEIPKGEGDKYRSLAHIKARAERYVSKRLLRDLWRAWRDQCLSELHSTSVPSRAPPSEHPIALAASTANHGAGSAQAQPVAM